MGAIQFVVLGKFYNIVWAAYVELGSEEEVKLALGRSGEYIVSSAVLGTYSL